jgi:hypothetical protein
LLGYGVNSIVVGGFQQGQVHAGYGVGATYILFAATLAVFAQKRRVWGNGENAVFYPAIYLFMLGSGSGNLYHGIAMHLVPNIMRGCVFTLSASVFLLFRAKLTSILTKILTAKESVGDGLFIAALLEAVAVKKLGDAHWIIKEDRSAFDKFIVTDVDQTNRKFAVKRAEVVESALKSLVPKSSSVVPIGAKTETTLQSVIRRRKASILSLREIQMPPVISPGQILKQATSGLRCIRWENMSEKQFQKSLGATTDSTDKSEPATAGNIDYFLSHSW